MALLKITNGMEKYSDANLAGYGSIVTTSLTGNASFPASMPILDETKLALAEFREALNTAAGGSIASRLVKNQKRKALIEKMHQLASFVLYIANGDRAVAASSNFTLNKLPQSKPPMEKPGLVKLTDGLNNGELIASIKPVEGARIYLFQFSTDPNGNGDWLTITSTSRKVFVKNLQSCTRYYCRVIAVGKDQQQVTSEVYSRVVQ